MNLRISGWTLVVASLFGAVCAAVIIAWPAEVSSDRYSYPFGATSYVVAQVLFACRDAATLLGLLGLAVAVWTRSGRGTRVGLVLALAGMGLFAAVELFAVTAADATVGSSTADAVDNAYGAPMTMHGVGLVIAGVGLARSRLLPGALGRWIVLATGVYLFVPVFPAVFAPMVVGRIAIGTWMLLYAGIGVAMLGAAEAPRLTRRARVEAPA